MDYRRLPCAAVFQQITCTDLHRRQPCADRKEDRATPTVQEGVRSKLKDRKSHQAGNSGVGCLGNPDPPSPGAARIITPAIGSHHLCGSLRGRGHQLHGLQFSTLNLSIQARRKQSSGDKGLSGGTGGLQPPATMAMPSLLSCHHADLVRAARGQGKVLGGLLSLWRGTGRRGAVAQASRMG